MTCHWVDPEVGALEAAEVLRPGGRLAAFWNVHQPPDELGEAFAAVYRRVLPGTPLAEAPRDPVAAYNRLLDVVARGIQTTGAFGPPERLRFDWERAYSTEEWLEQVPTFGGHSTITPDKLNQLLSGIGTAIDDVGGAFTMRYATLAVTAGRTHAE